MNLEKATDEQGREEKRRRSDLAKRYREIGISAVAGALKHYPREKPRKKDREIVPNDCD